MIITRLRLRALANEGGFFRQTWVSEARLPGGRAASSTICFLLTREGFSAWHRLQAEELWHYQAGDLVEHVQLGAKDQVPAVALLGPDPLAGHCPQVLVPGQTWQGARLLPGHDRRGWALLGCTVSPAWDEQEFELGHRETLLGAFPRAADWIHALTR